MKNNQEIDLSFAEPLKPAEMNKIHFGGNLTPITPEQLEKLAKSPPKDARQAKQGQS